MAVLDDPTTWDEWGKVDDEFAQMLADKVERRFPPVELDKLPHIRSTWMQKCRADMIQMLDGNKNHVTSQEISIPLSNGDETRALVFKPKMDTGGDKPLLVLIHGGGFLFGVAEMEAAACISATREYGCVSISLDYKLAPEAKFPTAYNDCWEALQWLATNASTIGASPASGFILGGTSSGGQMTAALSHMARDQSLSPPLTGVYLNVPALVQPSLVPHMYKQMYNSRKQNEGKTGLSKETILIFERALEADLESELWNPMLWRNGHANLPKTYFQVCGSDVLRDDALIYERILRKEYGIKTRLDIYPGLPHVFWYMFPGHSSVTRFHEERIKGLGWLLQQ
ncbi:hypothetical protein PFICI_06464 [Pestalotiopsis fici W106-1]|uniref:Alpha/beta hydrolase fold-3 domain-containing protein n=1 Tax=Pestalotiopsis fici (strain W106-1 / CGMCC3.15140) TaxID=1229662 RepID=W3X7U1_PESFW|nr:uncharacterized protein PFICI_06464 [Pestalotiopsis fici W106-1]ETS81462.1 hypothetical protein PFICI_06464 [Pestalotiopsis fici W106-1]